MSAARIADGPGSGTTVSVPLPLGPGAPTLADGDKVVLAFMPDAIPGNAAYAITDHQRGQALIFMLAMCAAIIVVSPTRHRVVAIGMRDSRCDRRFALGQRVAECANW